MKAKTTVLLLFVFAIALCPFGHAQKTSRPNFLIIVTDDQNRDEFTATYMPKTFQRIVQQGALFTNAFVTTPLCCPSRSSILTGLFAHHHLVGRNSGHLSSTNFNQVANFPQRLKKAGYFTGLVGKYLNVWNGSWRKKEFDYWVTYRTSLSRSWTDYTLIKGNERIFVKHEYVTDKLLTYCNDFPDEALASPKPFMLCFATSAPHRPAFPASRHADLYTGIKFARPPSFNEADISDKPAWIQTRIPILTAGEIAKLDELHLRQLQSLASVDEAIDALLSRLKFAGVLDQTMIIFLSDNGMFFGEHRLHEKGLFHDEAVHVPMAIRYPPLIPENHPLVLKQLVANIDLAPTIFDIARIASVPMDGSSLVPLFKDPAAPWREELLLEGWPDAQGVAEVCSPPFTAIRTQRYVYSETYPNTGTGAPPGCTFEKSDIPELYDLQNDPYEIQNVAAQPGYRSIRDELKRRLDAYWYVPIPQQK